MPNNALSEARKQVRNAYGEAFESKASDALVMSIAQPVAFSTHFTRSRGVSFALGTQLQVTSEAVGGASSVATAVPVSMSGPSTAIIELSMPEPVAPVDVEAGHSAWQELASTLSTLGLGGAAGADSVVRGLRAAQTRDAFDRAAGPLREQIGRIAGGARPQTTGLTTPLTQACWLNRTVRAVAHLPALAEVAQDVNVERIGLPRRLRQEASAKALDVLGSTAFRKRTKLTGKGIVLAVLDTEIAYKHPAFQGRVILKENFTHEPWGHPHFHGTAVAGLLAAGSPSFLGIAPEATIYHYKVLATDEVNNADDFGGSLAIQRALEDGAQVANCSWGIGPADHGTSREARAFDQAWSLGLVIVKSAGNEGSGGLTSPADAKGVIVVGATDRTGKSVIPESSRGATPNGRALDCVAPGGSSDDFLTSCKIDGKIGRVGFGTSFAAPQVAGLLALLLEQDRNQTPDQLRAALLASCQKLPGGNAKTQGKGLPVLS
jgi:serine protease AprX